MDEMEGGTDASMRKSSAASLVSILVELFEQCTMQMFTALAFEVVEECGENVLDAEMRFAFFNSGYVIRRCILTMTNV